MHKIKILHVSHGGLGHGGVSAVINSIVYRLFNEFDFGCVVYSKELGREKDFAKYGKLHRIKAYYGTSLITKLCDKFFRPFRILIGTYSICKKEEYDVIHCHNGFEAAFSLLGAKLAGVKNRIVHIHNPIQKKSSFIYKLMLCLTKPIINSISTKRVGCSEQACESFYYADYVVINNSVDLHKFVWHNKNNGENKVFIHVGRFCYQKNQSFLLDVFECLLRYNPYYKLLMVGFGEDKQKIENIIRIKQLDKNVQIIDGTRADVAEIMGVADYMIFPSVYEGFGIVLLEAQASGVHCFVSDAVQKVTDAGLWEQIPLAAGPKKWTEVIKNRIEAGTSKSQLDVMNKLKMYDMSVIARQYSVLYNEK